MERQDLIRKIAELPPSQLAEIEQFVESVTQRFFPGELELQQELTDYAERYAGTASDLDPEVEIASVDFLLRETSFNRKPRRRRLRRLAPRHRDTYGISSAARKRGYVRR